MESTPKHCTLGQRSCATNTPSSLGLSTRTRTWRKLVQVAEFGQRQSTNSVGGISAKRSEDDSKGIYPRLHTMLSAPITSMHSLTPPSHRMAALTQMTAREEFPERSVSKGYSGQMRRPSATTQLPSRFEFPPHTLCTLAKQIRARGTTWVGQRLPAVIPMHWKSLRIHPQTQRSA